MRHMYTDTCIQHTHTNTYIYTHTHTHTCIHTHMHTHTNIHTPLYIGARQAAEPDESSDIGKYYLHDNILFAQAQGKLRVIALVDLDVDNHNRMLFDQVT